MSKYQTRKDGKAGKARTIALRQARARKYGREVTRASREVRAMDDLTRRIIAATDERSA